MKDMTTVLNKKIVNKETNEVRLVVKSMKRTAKSSPFPWTSPPLSRSGMAAASDHLPLAPLRRACRRRADQRQAPG